MKEKENVAEFAEKYVRNWARNAHSLCRMIQNIQIVLLKNAKKPEFAKLDTFKSIEYPYKRCRVATHPDQVARWNPSILETEIGRAALSYWRRRMTNLSSGRAEHE